VTATDPFGAVATDVFTITVDNRAPIAGSIPAQTGLNVNVAWTFAFTATAFTDADNDALSYTFTVNPPAAWINFVSLTRTFSGTPPPSSQGTYTIVVTAHDPFTGTAQTAFDVTVDDRFPVLSPIPNQNNLFVGTPWTLAVTVNDADADTLTFVVTGLPAWASFNTATRTFSGTPTTGSQTTSIVSFSARDPFTGIVTQPFTITVVNRPPLVTNPLLDQANLPVSSPWSYAFAANSFTDPDIDPLTYTATGLTAWMSFDGSIRTISGTPPPGSQGGYSVVVTATDPFGLFVNDTFIVAVGNDHPVVAHPIPDQSPLYVGVEWSFTFGANAFSDPDNDTLIYASPALPAWVNFFGNNRSFVGVPPLHSQSSYVITVTAFDTLGLSAVQNFTITVVNRAPTVNTPLVDQTGLLVATPWSYTFADTSFVDLDRDPLTYSVAGLTTWMTFNDTTRTFVGTPRSGSQGTVTVSVTASDAFLGGSVVDSFTVTVANRAPTVVAAIPDQTVYLGSVWTFNVPFGTFSDPDADGLTFTAPNLPSWITFDSVLVTLSGTATTAGAFTVNLAASDIFGGSVNDSFVVNVLTPTTGTTAATTATTATTAVRGTTGTRATTAARATTASRAATTAAHATTATVPVVSSSSSSSSSETLNAATQSAVSYALSALLALVVILLV